MTSKVRKRTRNVTKILAEDVEKIYVYIITFIIDLERL